MSSVHIFLSGEMSWAALGAAVSPTDLVSFEMCECICNIQSKLCCGLESLHGAHVSALLCPRQKQDHDPTPGHPAQPLVFLCLS